MGVPRNSSASARICSRLAHVQRVQRDQPARSGGERGKVVRRLRRAAAGVDAPAVAHELTHHLEAEPSARTGDHHRRHGSALPFSSGGGRIADPAAPARAQPCGRRRIRTSAGKNLGARPTLTGARQAATAARRECGAHRAPLRACPRDAEALAVAPVGARKRTTANCRERQNAFKAAYSGIRRHKVGQGGTRWHETGGTKWHKMAQGGTRRLMVAQAGPSRRRPALDGRASGHRAIPWGRSGPAFSEGRLCACCIRTACPHPPAPCIAPWCGQESHARGPGPSPTSSCPDLFRASTGRSMKR